MTWQRRWRGFMVIVWTFWLVISVRTYFQDHRKLWIVGMVTCTVNIVFDIAAFKNGWLITDANKRQRDE
jgi:hypothetical protein